MYCCVHSEAPEDDAGLIARSKSERTMHLKETRYNNSYGKRAFSHVGQKLWNLLPQEITEEHELLAVKQKVKSFLLTRGEEFIEWTKLR